MSHTKWSIGVLILLLIAVAMASGLALARAEPLPRYRLALESSYGGDQRHLPVPFTLTIRNVSIDSQPVEARNVEIMITPLQDPNCTHSSTPDVAISCTVVVDLSSGAFDPLSGIWTIPSIPAEASARGEFRAGRFTPRSESYESNGKQITPERIRATVIGASSNLPAERLPSFAVEEWFFRIPKPVTPLAHATFGNAGVSASFERSTPDESGLVYVEVRVSNDPVPAFSGGRRLADEVVHESQYDVQVTLDLAELELADSLEEPSDTTFDRTTMTWDVGELGPDRTLKVPVTFSSATVPLDQRCLTARVTNAVPPFELDARRRANDVAKACLDEAEVLPHQIPYQDVTGDTFILWWIHNCVGISTGPCDEEDDIKVLSKSGSSYLDLESAFVYVPDPTSLELKITETTEDFAAQSSKWREYGPFTVTLAGLGGMDPPGTLIIYDESNKVWYAPEPSATQDPFIMPGYLVPVATTAVFETLGTYVVTYEASATGKNLTSYSDRATYTFRFGPMAELEVRDAREGSPLASEDERAYTIVAKHNGPDDAPAVEVSVNRIPEGSRAIVSEGTVGKPTCVDGYCTVVWTIGELAEFDRRALGVATQYPTLTLIAPSGAAAEPITASIRNIEDYSVTIKGASHSTDYFDYFPDNNTAEIAALPGTGEGDPGTPTDVETIGTSAGTLIRWTEAEYLNLWPVVGYQVERTSGGVTTTAGDGIKGNLFLDETPGENPQYRVRSMNEWGVGSIWSERVGAPLGEPSVTVEPTQLTVARSGEASSADYTVVLDSPPTGADNQVRIGVSSGDAAKATVSRSTLVFSEANWNIPQTVTVTWADANASGSVEITHSVSGGGYDGVTADAVRVTASGMVLNVSKPELTMSENGGQDTYTIALSSAPASDVFVDISSADSGVATVSPARLVFTPTDYGAKTVTVTGVDDQFLNAGGERVTQISHRLGGGGLPAVTLAGPAVTVTDDDQAGLTVSVSSVTVRETGNDKATKSAYQVKLNTRPESNVVITVSSDDTAVATVEPLTLTFTPSNWDTDQSVTVTAVNDDKDNDDNQRDTTISHTARGGGYDGQTAEVEVIVLDDDETMATIAVTGIPAGAGSMADTRISEYNGTTTMTIDLRRFFTEGEGVIPLCLGGDALPGTHYALSISGGDATLDMTNSMKPLIMFGENGARRVVVEFTGIVHGTTEGKGTKEFTVELCSASNDNDIRNQSAVTFKGDTMTHTVSIMDGLLLTEGESFDIPVPGSADGWFVLENHYGIVEQALPSAYTIEESDAVFKVTATDNGRSGDRRFDLVACNKGSEGCERYRSVAAFKRGNDTITVTIIDPVPGAPQQDSFGQSQDGDDAFPEISIVAGGDIAEGGVASFTITADPAPSANADVTVAVTQSGDFGVTVGSRTVTLGPSGTATLTVATADDSVDEADGSVTVTLSDGADYTVSSTQGAATVVVSDDDDSTPADDLVSRCVSDNLLKTVRYFYEANQDNPPNHGENWKRVLIAFGDVEDPSLTAYTADEARASEDVWAGWLPTRVALECLEDG